MFTKRTIRPAQVVGHVDTADEALVLSLTEKARVDLAYMAQVTGKSPDEIIRDLTGVIFRDPEQDEPVYLPADEYLSGRCPAGRSVRPGLSGQCEGAGAGTAEGPRRQ